MKCRNCRHLYKDWCVHKLDSPDPDLDRECKDYMQATRSDRIRAMSDEELAKFIATPCQCEVRPKRDGFRECGNDLCLQYLLKWLRQPAAEDT